MDQFCRRTALSTVLSRVQRGTTCGVSLTNPRRYYLFIYLFIFVSCAKYFIIHFDLSFWRTKAVEFKSIWSSFEAWKFFCLCGWLRCDAKSWPNANASKKRPYVVSRLRDVRRSYVFNHIYSFYLCYFNFTLKQKMSSGGARYLLLLVLY